MHILVTGANGQLGRALRARMPATAHGTFVERTQLDITCATAVRAAIARHAPDVVINAAAYTAVDAAEADAAGARAGNVDGPRLLAEVCSSAGVHLVHLSSDYVFGGTRGRRPRRENDICAPASEYGRTKLEGEHAVLNCDARHIVVRTSWLFSEFGANFVVTMLKLAACERVAVVNDQWGTPTYAGDLAGALLTLARACRSDADMGGLYHYAGYPETSWFGFASAVFDAAYALGIIRRKPHMDAVDTAHIPRAAQRPAYSALDTTRFRATFGVPASDWRAALPHVLSARASADETEPETER